jgi:hypothetical protein
MNFSSFDMPARSGSFSVALPEQIGISGIKRIDNHFSLELSLQSWIMFDESVEAFEVFPQSKSDEGKIYSRQGYIFADLSGRYNIYLFRKHNFFGKAGVSYATGLDEYVTNVWQIPGYEVHNSHSDAVRVHSIGANVGIGYNYALSKSRLNLGLSTGIRIMTHNLRYFEVNLNIGYNFSRKK